MTATDGTSAMRQPACSRPGAVTPEEIVAYVDGEAPPRVAEHVQGCPSCMAEATALGLAQNGLRRALHRFDCPTPQTLGEYELGMVTAEERTRIAGHLLGCPRCTDELRTLRAFLSEELMETNPATAGTGPIAALKRTVAALLVPPPQLAYGGLRGAAGAAVQTYRAGDLTITLGPGPDSWPRRASLMGLIVRETAALEIPEGSEARLITAAAAGGSPQTADIDDFGNFAFDDVAPGHYRLELHLADQVVVAEDVPVGD